MQNKENPFQTKDVGFFRLFFFNVLFLKYSPTGIQPKKKKKIRYKKKLTKHHR